MVSSQTVLVNDKFRWRKSFYVTCLLLANIALKEYFNFFENNNGVVLGCLIIFAVSLLFFGYAAVSCPPKFQTSFLYALFFFLMLAFSSFTNDPDYGLEKACLGLLVPFCIATLLNKRDLSVSEIVYAFAFSALFISLIAVGYKAPRGLFNRAINYGVLGPIPFGWVNGIAFLALALKPKRKTIDAFLIIFFFMMVIWSFSKGPLVSLLLISIYKFNTVLGKKISTKIFVIGLIVVSGFVLYVYASDIRSVRTIIQLLEDPDEYSRGAGQGSIGVRENYLQNSLEMFKSSPVYGVGFGNWANGSYQVDHKYPHNVVAELLAETGMIGFILFALLVLRVRANHPIMFIGYFGLGSLLFSGDFSYLRYALLPILTIMFISKPVKVKQRILSSNEQLT